MSDQPGRLVLAGLACLVVGFICFIAFLITATRELIRQHRRGRHMTHQPTPRETIAAALDDWWITTDPAAQFHATDVAAHVDGYLAEFGYTIHPAPGRPRPLHIAFGILSGLTAASTIQAAYQGNWWWITSAILAIAAVAYFTAAVRADDHDQAPE